MKRRRGTDLLGLGWRAARTHVSRIKRYLGKKPSGVQHSKALEFLVRTAQNLSDGGRRKKKKKKKKKQKKKKKKYKKKKKNKKKKKKKKRDIHGGTIYSLQRTSQIGWTERRERGEKTLQGGEGGLKKKPFVRRQGVTNDASGRPMQTSDWAEDPSGGDFEAVWRHRVSVREPEAEGSHF